MFWIRRVLLVVLSWQVLSCSTFENSGLPGSASSMALNEIMLVSKDLQTFGYYRIDTQRKVYPEMDLFLKQKGTPDFLAETRDENRRYFLMYYLKTRQAYACRTRIGNSSLLEFSGPYPIPSGEYRKLKQMKDS